MSQDEKPEPAQDRENEASSDEPRKPTTKPRKPDRRIEGPELVIVTEGYDPSAGKASKDDGKSDRED